MIVISDNIVINILIEEFGGVEVLNQLFQSWGLKDIVINNFLLDLLGINIMIFKDLINLILQVNQGGLVFLKFCDNLFWIMEIICNDFLLFRGIGRGFVIVYKIGNLKFVLVDVGMIDLVNGKCYLLVVFVKCLDNDQDVVGLICGVFKKIY